MDLTEIKVLVARHRAMPFEEAILDEVPEMHITQRCDECGSELPPIVVGWDQLYWAADHDEPMSTHLDIRFCERCTPADES